MKYAVQDPNGFGIGRKGFQDVRVQNMINNEGNSNAAYLSLNARESFALSYLFNVLETFGFGEMQKMDSFKI